MSSILPCAYPYVAYSDASLKDILRQIKLTSGFPIVVIDQDSTLFGVVSSGDIASHLSSSFTQLDSITAYDLSNRSPIVAHIDDDVDVLEGYLCLDKIRSFLLLTLTIKLYILLGLVLHLLILGHTLCQNSQPFLSVEIGVNHNGSLDEAQFLIQSAADAWLSWRQISASDKSYL